MVEMTGVDEIVQEFLVESYENLDQLDRDLVALEREPGSRELLASIFRTIHTIKGTSGFLAFDQLEQVTHVGESLLSLLRDGRLVLDPERTAALLDLVDAVRAILASVEATGSEGEHDHAELIARLVRLQEAPAVPVTTAAPGAATAGSPGAGAGMPGEPRPATRPEAGADSANRLDNTIRVDVDLLDSLMNLVGELVLTRNHIVAQAGRLRDPQLRGSSHRLDLLAGELHDNVMRTRLQPVGTVWSKLPRLVRDLGVACNRRVRVELEGGDTELDKTLIEAIKDPLTHLVRNAVDHGIEHPDDRRAAGKDPEGVISLRAFHEGGQVHLEIHDDGRGLDLARIADKAVERGLATRERVGRMSAREVAGFVFEPGFSTAAAVTNVSGRGVGMDVVRTNIEKIGGTVDIDTAPGAGSTIRLVLPLTLAIIPALTLECGGERYAVSQASVVELVSLSGQVGRAAIEWLFDAPVYRLRGRLLPVVHLEHVLGLCDEEATRRPREAALMVLQAGGRQFGLVVDRVVDTEEIVVKPLSSQLHGVGAYAGATITGDGTVALILDAAALAHLGGVQGAVHDPTPVEDAPQDLGEQHSVLIVGVGTDHTRVSIPLADVTRLEVFPASAVEQVGARGVVQYRDGLLPLAHLAPLFGATEGEPPEQVTVVVHSRAGRSVGFVVSSVVDIVEDTVSAARDLGQPFVTVSGVVHDHVTEALDVRRAALIADAMFYSEDAIVPGSDAQGSPA